MATTRDLITGALRLLNVVQANEVPTADDISISTLALNGLIDSWSAERLAVYSIDPYYFLTTPGQLIYVMGTNSMTNPTDWDIPRPMEILSMYLSYGANTGPIALNQSTTDLPMEKLNYAQYASINVKQTPSTFPTKFYDDGDYPNRNIYVWPVPTQVNVITAWLWEPLLNLNSLDTDVTYPKGYERALRFNLAVELAAEFGKEIPQSVSMIADKSKAVVKRLNSEGQVMRGDLALSDGKSGIFNWQIGDTTPS